MTATKKPKTAKTASAKKAQPKIQKQRHRHNFAALESAIFASTARHSGDPIPPREMWWGLEYPNAIDAVLTKDDCRPLLRLLDAQQPIHPMVLPALADAIKALRAARLSGNKRRLTGVEEHRVAHAVQRLRLRGENYERSREKVATTWGISDSVVKRAYETVIPPSMRPGRNHRKL